VIEYCAYNITVALPEFDDSSFIPARLAEHNTIWMKLNIDYFTQPHIKTLDAAAKD